MSYLRTALAAGLLLSGAALARTVAFTDVNVFDGEQLLESTTVLVEDGIITAVGTDVPLPAEAEVIDGTGQTLLPGLIDAHQHVFTPEALEQNLVFGVTTVLDMFTVPGFASAMRAEQEAGTASYRADLFSAGVLATAPHGHGTQFGVEVAGLTDPAQAPDWVAERLAEGSDYIKVVIETGEEMGYEIPSLDQELAAAVTAAAHAEGLLVLTHVQTLEAARAALEAGTDGLAHIFTDEVADASFVEAAATAGLFVVPTLTVFQSLPEGTPDTATMEDPYLQPYLLPLDLQNLSQPFAGFPQLSAAAGLESVRLLHEAGVPVLAGTDAMNPGTTYGASLHRELELLVEAGLSPAEALAAATSATAELFGLTDRGFIREGLRADLLLVEGNPVTDILATRRIIGVWKDGEPADRAGWLAGAEAGRAAAAEQAEQLSGDAPVLISDFETGQALADFGQPWAATDDSAAGGDSRAVISVTEGGAAESGFALQVDGSVGEAFPFPWSGAMFMPAAVPFAPADLSAVPVLSFQASGTPGDYRVQLYCSNLGQAVVEAGFPVSADWQTVSVDLREVGGCDVSGVNAIIITSGTPGEFSLRLDDVYLNPAD